MTLEHLTEQLLKQSGEIAAVRESLKSAHKRIDDNDRIIEGIHKLAANMEAMTMQVKSLAEQLESSVERLEAGQRSQGERISALEKEPATKWKNLVSQGVGLITAAIIGYALSIFKK